VAVAGDRRGGIDWPGPSLAELVLAGELQPYQLLLADYGDLHIEYYWSDFSVGRSAAVATFLVAAGNPSTSGLRLPLVFS